MTSAPSSPKARQGHVRGQERQGQGQETRTRQGQESEQDGESCSLSCKEGEVSDETPTDTAVSGSQEPGRGNPFVEPEISCFWTTLEERIRMKHRRDAALKLRADPGRWSRLVLAGLRELAADAAGPGTAAIVRTGLLHAFQDFATHIRYFQITRGLMEAAGMAVPLTANASSSVHDVDKLDPVMLAGYCERWEDVRDTALWHACLEYHYAINTHHQQNELWHMEEGETKEEQCCRALPELLCDKASRKLQKELNGVVSSTMWSVETQFYLGIPDKWFDRALEMAASLASCRKIHQTNT
ncbi:uncharacterized protein [Dermacentor andersoni]|uniref:uncharacterized protein isoform X4 n=1 Tax=Dermacentor andersoni TaxID=34620 RepID=UPI0024160154|nr:uncharacterized protein LOC126531703 isoform X4 [Dermacentor andersoni]